MKLIERLLACLMIGLSAAAPANAGEVFGGLLVHDVKTPLTLSGVEAGLDVQLGWRGDPLPLWRLQPYALVGIHTAGKTHYAVAGVSRTFGGGRVYIRPGVGLAVHSGSTRDHQVPGNHRIEFGSRILFAPELAVGTRINERTSIEAAWVHLSHAQFFSGQNPGIDNIGVRLNYRFR